VKRKIDIKDGKYDGAVEKYYYDDGQISIKGNYKEGEKNGNWIYYSKEGSITKEENYNFGIIISKGARNTQNESKNIIFNIPIGESFTIGPDNAKVTIIEWMDFQ